MTLFHFNRQFRETAGIFRLLQSPPLRYGLAEGRVFRWFAVNIPMDLLKTSAFRGDLDLIACLRSNPSEHRFIKYLTWEVKFALIDRVGRPKSLKGGKTAAIIKQLRIHRRFGSPEASLLEMFLCEDSPTSLKHFPSPPVFTVIKARADVLKREMFGYKILPFQHGRRDDEDVGVFTIQHPFSRLQTAATIVRPPITTAGSQFLELMATLDEFAASGKKLGFFTIVFCKHCRKLGSIPMRSDPICPNCQAFLVAQ